MRFVRYAMGEILLVVIGILIALQINNWNEERIEQNEIREYALNLSSAIERDMAMLEPVFMQIRAGIRQAEEAANYLRGRDTEDIDNADLFFFSTLTGYRPYGWIRAALDQLKAAGGLRSMKNTQLAQLIADYDALSRHLDQDYQEDLAQAKAVNALFLTLVNRNYPPEGLREKLMWDDGFTDADIERRLNHFMETELYKEFAAMDLPLLSQDLVEFRHLANLYRDYAESVWPRTEIELPQLRQFAREIQTLIDQEYR